jgi:hypothetical protein
MILVLVKAGKLLKIVIFLKPKLFRFLIHKDADDALDSVINF